MEAQATTAKVNDLVLGYKLTRKIGSGGYGDVWEAEAPGGLKKALKIVFGYSDERRAQAELKALDRIKEARHPFLLSLERIEIFNSQLIVVSELADKSLADLANEFRTEKGEGIPRDELVKYMKETADALDYLNDEFQLQHLDIKPENILLVSGHAKVADFGLVKDIKNQTQSLMSGMTPAYAAPELFDGQPGTASDQYSLAVVYQEMLTTMRPFRGSTTAQLAVQHMHGKPDLMPLPVGDQAVIAKALSKNPTERYASCAELVEQLTTRKSRKKAVKSRATVREVSDTSCNTVVVHGTSRAPTDIVSGAVWGFKSADIQSFDPPECDPQEAEFQPTVVIAVGESSAKVVRKFKQRLADRFGSMDKLPSLKFLCMDADNDTLARMTHNSDGCSLGVNETLAVPLRRPEQYRKINNLDLSWLSRRWIYNVPRNLKIDGLRPLGRLVFADHFEKICDRISDCIKQSIQIENLASSCQTLEMNPPHEIRPNVILVSNISGGIGSGMTNDLAYTIRLMLAENGVSDASVTGMLMHGIKAGREVALATANTYAYLCELRHFADQGYPGDPRLGIPEFEEDLPFDYTYGLRLNLTSEESKSDDLDRIADYLFLSTSTNCSAFFDAARLREKDSDEFTLRSFGLGISGPGQEENGAKIVEDISRGVIDFWLRGPIEDFHPPEFAMNLAETLDLDASRISIKVTSAIVNTPDWEQIRHDVENAPRLYKAGAFKNYQNMQQFFDEIYGAPIPDEICTAEPTQFSFAVEPEITEMGQQLGDQMCAQIFEMINGTEVNFAQVDAALDACIQYVECQLRETRNCINSLSHQLSEVQQSFERSIDSGKTDVLKIELSIMQYSKLRLQEFGTRNCHLLFRTVKGSLASAQEVITKLKLQLDYIGQQFQQPDANPRSNRSNADINKLLLDRIGDRRNDMVRLAQRIAVQTISTQNPQSNGFMDLVKNSVAWQKQLPDIIRGVARSVMWSEFKQLCVDDVIEGKRVNEMVTKHWLGSLLNAAVPFVTDCGGAATLLFTHPRHSRDSKLPEFIQNAFDVKSKGIAGTYGNVVVCFEAEGILLANYAFSILKDAPEATELARRIQSRDDIKWTNMEDLL